MKRVFAFLLAAALSHTAPASAQAPSASPLLGAWAVDVSKLPIPPEQRPRSVTFTYSEAADGKWTTKVDIVGPDGTESHGSSTYTRDGTPAPVVNSPEADMSAVTMPRPDVLIMALSKGGVGGSIRIYTVAPDGKTMTETANYFRQDGTPVARINYFSRVR